MKKRLAKKWQILVPGFVLILAMAFAIDPGIFKLAGNEKLAGKLELTEDQKNSFEQLKGESQERMIDLEARMKKARLKFGQQMKKDDVNEGEVMQLIEEMGAVQTEMKKISVSNLIEAKNILTPEQREKARDLIGKWKAQRKKMQAKNRAQRNRQYQRPLRQAPPKQRRPQKLQQPGPNQPPKQQQRRQPPKRHSGFFGPDDFIEPPLDREFAVLQEPEPFGEE